ncbi:hypothetical protein U3516DRAFT_600832 [Neocallimastix sp. 'constans']|jgi:hypothetical protein
MNENSANENSIQNNHSLKNYSEILLAPENNTSSSNMNLNTPVISQPQTSPSLPPNEGPTTSFQQSYISSFTNVNPTRNIWIKRFTDIDATKIPFSGEDVHDLKVSILQFFGPTFIGSSAELGFVTVWKGNKKLLPGQVIDSELLKGVTCESPLLLKNTHGQTSNSPSNHPTSEILDFDVNKSINLESNDDNQLSKQEKEAKNSKVNSISLNDVNSLTLSNLGNIQGLSGINNISLLNQLSGGNNGNNSSGSLRNQLNSLNNLAQLNQLNGISGLNQLNSTTSNPSTSIQTLSSLAPLSNTLVNLNSIQASLNSINATTAASLNSSTSSPLNTNIGMNNIINGLVSLQNLNNARGLTTSTFNDSLTISPNSNTDKIASNTAISTVANSTSIPSLQNSNSRPNNTNSDTNNNYLNSNSKVGSPVTVEDQNNSQHSDNEEPLDPEEQVNAIYPQNVEVPKEIEDAVHRNTNRGWRLITVIDTNDIPKFFEDQPQDWRVQRSATDRYPGYLVINYIGGLEGERNNMPSKALNLTWSPETNDPSSKMYRKSKDLIDKQSMMYGSRFFCKGYPWCPSIVSSLNSIDAETTDISSKNGKKLAKKLRTSLTQSAAAAANNTSSPSSEGGNLYRNGNNLLLDSQNNSMKRNFDCMRHGGRSMSDDGKQNTTSSQSHRSLKVSCNATLKIEIYASNLKKAVIYGKNLHGILGPISEFRPSDRIMSEACRAALSKDITYTRFLRQAEAMAIKYNIPKHRIPNRTQIRTFFERSRRGNRLAGYASNTESPSASHASINTSHALLNSSLVSNIQAISILNQPQESTNYSSITTDTSKMPTTNPTHIQIPNQSPRLSLSNYHTSTLPNNSLIDSVDNVDVDMYSNNDLGIIKITPTFNSMNSIGFNSGLSGITASIANDLTTGINTSLFNHTNSTTSNTNSNNTNFHSTLFNS